MNTTKTLIIYFYLHNIVACKFGYVRIAFAVVVEGSPAIARAALQPFKSGTKG